jgi:hypothetical protein
LFRFVSFTFFYLPLSSFPICEAHPRQSNLKVVMKARMLYR